MLLMHFNDKAIEPNDGINSLEWSISPLLYLLIEHVRYFRDEWGDTSTWYKSCNVAWISLTVIPLAYRERIASSSRAILVRYYLRLKCASSVSGCNKLELTQFPHNILLAVPVACVAHSSALFAIFDVVLYFCIEDTSDEWKRATLLPIRSGR